MIQRAARWCYDRAGVIALLVACVGIAGGVRASRIDDEARQEAREDAARNYVMVLRSACEDRNARDAKLLAGVRVVARELEADDATVQTFTDALRRRDCDQVYPMPRDGVLVVAPARESGMTPLRRGDSGYNPDLDADGDGVACE